MTVAAVVITLNEEKRIAQCLGSLTWVDELIVVDAGSTDRTCEIAGRYTDRVYHNPWPGYGEQKNFGASKASSEWVLSLDADEVVTLELAQEIRRITASPDADDGYYVPRLAFFLGRPIRHCGWHPNWQLRLWRRGRGEFSARPVHETAHVDGSIGRLSSSLLHYTCTDLAEYLEKLNRYTTLDARDRLFTRAGTAPEQWAEGPDSGARPQFRVFWYHLVLRPPLRVFEKLVLRKGFLDGLAGWMVSVLSGVYTFMLYAKMWQYSRPQNAAVKEVPLPPSGYRLERSSTGTKENDEHAGSS